MHSLNEIWGPQDPPLLLTTLLDRGVSSTSCSVVIGEQTRFLNDQKRVPVWFGLEYLTQAITVHERLCARAEQRAELQGHFAEASKIDYSVGSFELGQQLVVEVKFVHQKDGSVLFNGWVTDSTTGEKLVSALLTVYQPHRAQAVG